MQSLLVVEDNVNDRRMVEYLLGDEYRLLFADTLDAAKSVLEFEALEAVVLDLNLPDSRGVGTLTALIPLAKHVPVVVWSGADDAGQAVRAGAADFVLKDGKLDNIKRAIARAIVHSKYGPIKDDIRTMKDMIDRDRR